MPDPTNVSATIGGTNASDFTVGSTAQTATSGQFSTQITATSNLSGTLSINITITSGGLTSNTVPIPAVLFFPPTRPGH